MTSVTADPTVPVIRVSREFRATPARLLRAHTDPDLFVQWVGPDDLETVIDRWDARTGGCFRYVSRGGGAEFAFFGSFHEIRADRIVQTFTYEGDPDRVALNTLRFADLGGGRTRLDTESLVDSFETRAGWLRSGMERGLDDGFRKLERMLTDGTV